MKTKIFKGKKITIRNISEEDFKNVQKFKDFVDSLVEEQAKVSMKKRVSLEEEKRWIERKMKGIENLKEVFLLAECEDKIVGTTGITLEKDRRDHIGGFGITIRKGYRRIGLGKYLMNEILKKAKKELKPRPKIIRLSVFLSNKPAIALYKKIGFKTVAKIPKQLQYKGKLEGEGIMIKIF